MKSRVFLDTFKKDFNIENDKELALKIGTSKANIDKWIQRDKIPNTWIKIIRQMSEDKKNSKVHSNLYMLKKLNSKVSAGYGEENIDKNTNIFPICKIMFKTQINESDYKVIEVIGDSMQPTMNEGDHVIIKEKHSFIGDGLYVIRKGNELFVKRVIKNLDGSCTIKSDNPNYPDLTINKETDEEHYIIGKVKAILPQIED